MRFFCNIVLGRLALLGDDVEVAEKHLLLCGTVSKAKTIFWGQNMTLALELLKRNRGEVVLHFLEECKHFMSPDCPHPEIDEEMADIRAGRMPINLRLTYPY